MYVGGAIWVVHGFKRRIVSHKYAPSALHNCVSLHGLQTLSSFYCESNLTEITYK